MARTPKPWYWKERRSWYVTIRGERQSLGPDKKEGVPDISHPHGEAARGTPSAGGCRGGVHRPVPRFPPEERGRRGYLRLVPVPAPVPAPAADPNPAPLVIQVPDLDPLATPIGTPVSLGTPVLDQTLEDARILDQTGDDEFFDANLTITSDQEDLNQTLASAMEESKTEEEVSTPDSASEGDHSEERAPTPTSPTFQPFAMDRPAPAPLPSQAKPFQPA